ncbi:phytoene desaturase family protein [Lacisediminihabitans profunda]|uniref:NAD(P)/FAD-dependent oxidoreductase n=1 Tax=Lacisediminihabitans profunda TaxID=2594790 RepID=A0A5C8USC6_9MICO|nr:NAD(P)/FAD-dependent oxidoreductase [Lacisediminihabitans profunda]TXN31484.1 NAD(P)/FAD-dependent oxidoreductase [Lacisediminihabitans profunda]
MDAVDAIVVGSGPNGMAAAVTLARAGLTVRVYERAPTIGGGARTSELTLPGFHHDVCSAVHPLALASGFFRRFELRERIGLVVPEISYAHPLADGRAGIAWRDLDRTADGLGRDGAAWRRLFAPLVRRANDVAQFSGSAVLQVPRHPLTVARLGLRVLEQGGRGWNSRFRDDVAPALLTGVFAHAVRPMPSLATAATGLVLGTTAHAQGWPIPIGGSQSIIDAMAADLIAHGGQIVTGTEIAHLGDLPPARVVLFDTSARALARIAGELLPERYRRALGRYRYGNAVAKVDFALSGPVPWRNRDLAAAGTLHLGGSRRDIARSEGEVAAGRHPGNPYVLVSQPTPFDGSRAPAGSHVLWAYTHVPRGSTVDRTEAITAAIESHAPGFRDVVLASASSTAEQVEAYNPNYVGGDIASGDVTVAQLVARPVFSATPWRTPARGIYLCSSSASPGPGVHGLAGYYAALTALRDEFGATSSPPLGRTGAGQLP